MVDVSGAYTFILKHYKLILKIVSLTAYSDYFNSKQTALNFNFQYFSA